MSMVKIIEGVIERRILVNYRMKPDILAKILPAPFEPRIFRGYALGGICLIRFKKMRPAGLPEFLGTSSENGTHRFCVQWKQGSTMRTGIFVKQRFTSSRLHEFGGDRVFPGRLTFAKFDVQEQGALYRVRFQAGDDFASVEVEESDTFSRSSLFDSMEQASRDFEEDKIGFSPDTKRDTFRGVELETDTWSVRPLDVIDVQSSLFSNTELFPEGSIEHDHALLMRDISHSWRDVETICCG